MAYPRIGGATGPPLPRNDQARPTRRRHRDRQAGTGLGAEYFNYERDKAEESGFTPPLAAAYEATGDCDSRAVVAAIVLERLGIDSILMVSREYSHAMLGVDVPGGGQRFAFNGKNYLVGETTTKIGIGMIAASMADWSKWMGIDLAHRGLVDQRPRPR